MVLDTRDNDLPEILNQIAAAIDAWFSQNRAGLNVVTSEADVEQLVEDGVLVISRPAPPPAPPAVERGTGTAGGRTPAPTLRQLGDLPAIPSPIPSPAITPATGGMPSLRWWKQLTMSDVMRKPPTSHQRNHVILNRAGHPIDQKTWFRNVFFAPVAWRDESMRSGKPIEVVDIPLQVFINEVSRGEYSIRFDHAEHRIANQNNAPTWLQWSGLTELIRSQDFEDWYLVLERLDPATYRLRLSETEPA
jgi:hypothetical protein